MTEIKIIEEKENSLFNRKEVNFLVESSTNPTKLEMSNLVSEKFKQPGELVIIEGIKGNFGSNQFSISAKVYNTKEDREKNEGKIPVVEAPKEEAKVEGQPIAEQQDTPSEQPAEAPAPAEENKSEGTPQEEKKE